MDRKLKQALAEAYRAPAPERKAAFLKQHRRRELGRWELAAVQVRYVRWWVWGLSLALFGGVLWMASPARGMGGWYAAAFTPFLALLMVMENGRSQVYQMEELELACRMSRRSVILARMVALGLFHLVLFGLLTPLLAVWSTVEAVQAGVYLLTPYLLTSALGMELTRRIRGREGLLACGAVTAAISVSGPIAVNIKPALYQPENLIWWEAALAASMIAAGVEFMMNVKNMGELQWN